MMVLSVNPSNKNYLRKTFCLDCGCERWVQSNRKGLYCRSCSNKRNGKSRRGMYQGENAFAWHGGLVKHTQGYSMIYLYPDDFFSSMADSSHYVMEHRLVMAKYLGRCLQPWEIIHHKNHIRNDNHLDNLQLITDDRHKQITLLENRIKYLEKRITLLETENTLLKGVSK